MIFGRQKARAPAAPCLLGLTLACCGGSVPPPSPGPPAADASAASTPTPAAEPQPHLTGVPVYDPATAAQGQRRPPALSGTITPPELRECTVDDLVAIKALMHRASSAYVEARYDEAISMSRRALDRCKNKNYMAHQIIGASSCRTRDGRTARQSYARIPPGKKKLIQNVCRGAGIELTP